MSVITSVILTVSCVEDGFDLDAKDSTQIDRINGFIQAHGHSDLQFLTVHMCGEKHPQTFTFGGGYNLFPEEDFLEFLDTIQWQCPENTVVVLQPESGDTIVWRPSAYDPD
jgi:hypothetical protein